MSDGITEGYRASRALNRFEEMWQDAQADQILLDAKSLLDGMSVEDLIMNLMSTCSRVQFRNYDRFVIPYAHGHYYATSAPVDFKGDMIRLYEIEVSGRVHRNFTNSSFLDALKEATLFAEWLETDSGKRAAHVHDDY